MIKEHQIEYETYMKKVVDSFITMNASSLNNSEWHNNTSAFYEIIWKEGIDYSMELNCSLALTGMTIKEMKDWNFKISKKYLRENSITYDMWVNKFKKNS